MRDDENSFQQTDDTTIKAQLLAIVEVDYDQRIRCQEPGCNHPVYRAIHVVRDRCQLLLLGSTCYAKRYGSDQALGQAQFTAPGSWRQLSKDERQLLLDNTQELLAKFEAEALTRAEAARLRMEQLRAQSAPPTAQPRRHMMVTLPSQSHRPAPWPWMKPRTSMAYFKLTDGTAWIRVQHQDGRQMLVPWPAFDGWDECYGPSIGNVDAGCGAYALRDVFTAIPVIRKMAVLEKVTGIWAEIEILSQPPALP